MKTKSLHQKRQAALMLMHRRNRQADVAESMGVTQKTISEWIQTEDYAQIEAEMLKPVKMNLGYRR